jgi:ectoine hydroxylase-related dioxygenase (phytanoyl-CoA dioxygenase family)
MLNQVSDMDTEFPLQKFSENGLAILRKFYDPDTEINPIREGIRKIIELVAKKNGIDAPVSTADEAMSSGYRKIAQANRALGSEIYDAVKQIPAFMQLVSLQRNVELFENIRKGSVAGLAAGGYGIRIDSPDEEKFRSHWHQEFPFQLRSLDGIVFWSPLLKVTPELGPVEIAMGSHREGLVPVYDADKGQGKTGAYRLYMDREAERVSKYKRVSPCTDPGDLILLDFLTLHQSGFNTSSGPRWTMQFRLFNFNDAMGLRLGWRGSFAAGVNFAEIVPELANGRP